MKLIAEMSDGQMYPFTVSNYKWRTSTTQEIASYAQDLWDEEFSGEEPEGVVEVHREEDLILGGGSYPRTVTLD